MSSVLAGIFLGLFAMAADPRSSSQCLAREAGIREEIKIAGACKADNECVVVKLAQCPFGCNQIVNKTYDVKKLKAKFDEYASACTQCAYECTAPPTAVACVQKLCVSKP